MAVPLVPGVVEVAVEAYDGDQWFRDWDSDYDGLPLAVRVTVTASGCRLGADEYDAPLATLRTVVPIDRVPPPADELEPEELLPADQLPADEALDGQVPGEIGDPFDSGGGTTFPGGGSGKGGRGGATGGRSGDSGGTGGGGGGGSTRDRSRRDSTATGGNT